MGLYRKGYTVVTGWKEEYMLSGYETAECFFVLRGSPEIRSRQQKCCPAYRFPALPDSHNKKTEGGNVEEYERIVCFESLYAAHKKARRSKQNRDEVVRFELYLTENLQRLSYQLQQGIYRIQGYHCFEIHDPKTRQIQALSYRDRVVQHSLCDNVVGPYLDKRLIYDNAACRVGKGTHFAMNRLTGFMRDLHTKNGGEGYILKCDVRKYFDSIDHAVLKKMVDDMGLCDRTKWLLNLIIDSYHEQEGKGLPMGNQTSQWFALYYLNGLDRLVKEQLRIRYYTRYMDDMILVHPDKEVLTQCLVQMRDYAESVLHLEFNQKTQIHSVEQGVDYLGFHFYLTPTGKVLRLLRQQNKKKFKRKLRAFRRLYRNGEIDSTQIGKSLVSYRGHLKHGHTYHLRKQIWSELVLRRGTSAPYTQDGEHVTLKVQEVKPPKGAD